MTPSSRWTPTPALVVRVSPIPWQLDSEFLGKVEAYWSEVTNERPHLFRGPVLAVEETNVRLEETRLEARMTDFAHFLYSRHHLEPDHPYHVRIVTACAWVVTADGLAVVGLTHPESAKPWVLQPIGGSPSLDDIHAGYFDPVAAATRELTEETGLYLTDGAVRGFVQLENGSIAIAVRFSLNQTWRLAAPAIRRHIQQLTERELVTAHGLRPGTLRATYQGFRVLDSVQDFLMAPELNA